PASGGSTSTEGIIEVSETGSAAPAPVPPIVTGSPEVRPPKPVTPTPPVVPERKAPESPMVPPLPPPGLPDVPPQSQVVPAKMGEVIASAVTLNVANAEPAVEVGHE